MRLRRPFLEFLFRTFASVPLTKIRALLAPIASTVVVAAMSFGCVRLVDSLPKWRRSKVHINELIFRPYFIPILSGAWTSQDVVLASLSRSSKLTAMNALGKSVPRAGAMTSFL